jgi:hypothetical protein
MTHRIRPALQRTLTLVLALLVPATGQRRKPAPAPSRATPLTASGLRLLTRTTAPPQLPAKHRPRQRSRTLPVDNAPTIDSTSPLVRPYLLAQERQERRTTLALALDGIDVGPWIIHGHPVGTPAMGVAA